MRRLLSVLVLLSFLIAACSGASIRSPLTASEPPRESGGAARGAPAATQPKVGSGEATEAEADESSVSARPETAKAAGGATDAVAAPAAPVEGPQAKPTTSSTNPVDAPPIDRMIIYTTSLTLLVGDIFAGINHVSAITQSLGGFVAGIDQYLQEQEPYAMVVLKVPAQKYQDAMNQLRSQGIDVRDERTSTQDVTEEFSDLEIQITSLEATYAQYLELMKKARTVEEILLLQERIDEVKLQIERTKGRANFLQHQAAFATITVTLRPAQDVLVREYSIVIGQKRGLEFQQAQLLDALRRAATPEERAQYTDQLSQITYQLEYVDRELASITQKALLAKIELPTPDPRIVAQLEQEQVTAEQLSEKYLQLRVEVRRQEIERDRLLEQINQVPAPANAADLRSALQAKVLELKKVNDQLRDVVARAQRENVTLPDVDSSLLRALVGDSAPLIVDRSPFLSAVRDAWEASLEFLSAVGTGLAQVVVFFWWLIPFVVLAAILGFRAANRRVPSRGRAPELEPAPTATPPAPPAPAN